MLETGIVASLIITTIYTCFQQGMILGWLRIWCANLLDKYLGLKTSRYVQKPLWDCLPCMSSVWMIVLTQKFNLLNILLVCGITILIDKYLDYETGIRE